MEGTKSSRRRVHENDFETNHLKRKHRKKEAEAETNSVEILGETHVAFTPKNINIRNYHNEHGSKRLLASAAICTTTGGQQPNGRIKDRVHNGALRGGNGDDNHHHHHAYATSLSSNLRESERMLFVQRWINSIPANSPLWIQISLDEVVPITNPHCYPIEEQSNMSKPVTPDCMFNFASINNSNSLSQTSNVLSSSMKTKPNNSCASTILGPRFPNTLTNAANANNNTNNIINSSNNNNNNNNGQVNKQLCLHHENGLLKPIEQRTSSNYLTDSDYDDKLLPVSNKNKININNNNNNSNNSNNNMSMNMNNMNGLGDKVQSFLNLKQTNTTTTTTAAVAAAAITSYNKDSHNSIGKLFDDAETQMVVKLFRDYFTKGSCPMLKEVRNRILNTVLDGKRTPHGIRAKIKRLQKSGQWTDYTGI